jgi:16S rRNA (uracil1498-N3)-methyltransferase
MSAHHRFFLQPELTQSDELVLRGAEAHHALHVLRIQPGMAVVVLNGAGDKLDCTVGQTMRQSVILIVRGRKAVAPLPYRVTLLQAIPKSKTIELIIQKAVELGACRVVPLLSERSSAHLNAEAARARSDKWRAIAIAAIKQCGSAWLPQIDAPVTPASFLANGETFDLSFIGSLHERAQHPRTHFQEFSAKRQHTPRSLAIWVGPEGDFSPAELSAIQRAGALPVTLGPLVLRSETAAFYCLSIVNYELQWAYRCGNQGAGLQ